MWGTALPNLHPALVHFPIALLSAAVLFDAACLALRRQVWLDRAAAALYGLGALGAWAAFLAGGSAEEGLRDVAPPVEALIEQHEEWAERTLWSVAILALARVAFAWWQRREPEVRRLGARMGILALAGVAMWLMMQTADFGGALVYRHGVAVGGAPGIAEGSAAAAED